MTQRLRVRAAQAGEATLLGVAGAGLGWLVGGLLGSIAAMAMAVVAGVNGIISGWRGVYSWRTSRGVVAWVLDSTWASVPVGVGLLAHVAAAVSGKAGYAPSLSHRQNRHVYRGGLHLQAGFALTVGNVISSAGDLARERRRKLITDHESVHIWQARWFGPTYLVLYIGWTVVGAAVGVLRWWHQRQQPPATRVSLGAMVESCSYYLNPFEWWAYSRDNLWPPPGLAKGVGWRSPLVRPLAEVRIQRSPDTD